MIETKIYIGLNDAETKRQMFETDKYKSLLKIVCRNYRIPFSLSINEGGYFHENGEYTEETTLILTLLDVPGETAENVAKDLCAFFHQESVMITYNTVKVIFVSDRIGG